MPEVAVIAVNITGDVGGTGISRFHVKRTDALAITVADGNSAAAAIRAFYNQPAAFLPTNVIWSFPTQFTVIDETSAILVRYMNLTTPPANVVGTASGSYAGGNGARVDWLTSTVRNRRLMRATTYMIPLGNNSYTGTGGVGAGVTNSLTTGGNTLLASLATANLQLVSYHRPAKGATTGGSSGPVTAFKIPLMISTLRSRKA